MQMLICGLSMESRWNDDMSSRTHTARMPDRTTLVYWESSRDPFHWVCPSCAVVNLFSAHPCVFVDKNPRRVECKKAPRVKIAQYPFHSVFKQARNQGTMLPYVTKCMWKWTVLPAEGAQVPFHTDHYRVKSVSHPHEAGTFWLPNSAPVLLMYLIGSKNARCTRVIWVPFSELKSNPHATRRSILEGFPQNAAVLGFETSWGILRMFHSPD